MSYSRITECNAARRRRRVALLLLLLVLGDGQPSNSHGPSWSLLNSETKKKKSLKQMRKNKRQASRL
jgi:hypothetical protein